MDGTDTITTDDVEIIGDAPTVNLDAEVAVTFTVSRTIKVDALRVALIIEDVATAALEQGATVVEPDPDWYDLSDATEYVFALLDENPEARDTVLMKWAGLQRAEIEDEDFTVEEVV